MEPVVSHLGPLPLLQVQLVIGCVRRSHLCNALKVTRSGQQVSRLLDSPWRQPKSEVTGDPNNTEMTDSDTYIGRAALRLPTSARSSVVAAILIATVGPRAGNHQAGAERSTR